MTDTIRVFVQVGVEFDEANADLYLQEAQQAADSRSTTPVTDLHFVRRVGWPRQLGPVPDDITVEYLMYEGTGTSPVTN